MNIFITSTCLLIVTSITSCTDKANSSTTKAKEANQSKIRSNIVDEETANFLIKSEDARMMGIREGTEAQKSGSTKEVKDYGTWMISEQSKMQVQLKALAVLKKVTLPQSISDDKKDGLMDLQKQSGQDFDHKFIKMMTIDHKRDLRDFEKASKSDDKEVAAFALKFLPVIQSHLDKLTEINKNN